MRFVLIVISSLILVGCGATEDKPYVAWIQDMMVQPSIKAQDFHPYDKEKSGMLVPPEGTWPKGVEPYLYKGKPVDAGQKLTNPQRSNSSKEFLALGKRHFDNFCLVCHGVGGAGDGPVAAKFQGVKPPSLLTDKIKNYPDGRIFHIITDGQGVMGSYIHQLPKEIDRWAVVNYVRSLQKK